jgi:transposase
VPSTGDVVAAAAMARSINANLLRRWITEAEGEGDETGQGTQKAVSPPTDAFIALSAPTRPQPSPPIIQIEVRRGSLTVIVQWPTCALHECTVWLREVLK